MSINPLLPKDPSSEQTSTVPRAEQRITHLTTKDISGPSNNPLRLIARKVCALASAIGEILTYLGSIFKTKNPYAKQDLSPKDIPANKADKRATEILNKFSASDSEITADEGKAILADYRKPNFFTGQHKEAIYYVLLQHKLI